MTDENAIPQDEEAKRAEFSGIDGQIRAYRLLLSQSDYQALKHADGELSDEEYALVRETRQQWRQAINDLQAREQSLLNPPAASADAADDTTESAEPAETVEPEA